MASNGERREFEKYVKFLVNKLVQVVVQSRKGQRLMTNSTPTGNEWFNVTISDDKHINSELKRSLEGRLPQPGQPVTLEIHMETQEGDTLVLEVWSVNIDTSRRDIGVSVSHLLYPRLSLMLKSVVALSRTTPTYRLSRQLEDDLKFTYRVYIGTPDVLNFEEDFLHVRFGESSCSYGTVELSLHYRPSVTLPDRTLETSLVTHPPFSISSTEETNETSSGWISNQVISPPFALPQQLSHSKCLSDHLGQETPPFAGILAHKGLTNRQGSDNSTVSDAEVCDSNGEAHLTLPVESQEQHGYVVVDLQHIKPPFAEGSTSDDATLFLQQCKEVPHLDLFTGDQSMNIDAAMALIDDRLQINSTNH